MHRSVATREELLSYLVDSQDFTLVKESTFDYLVVQGFVEEIALRSPDLLPPYPLVRDITAVVFNREGVSFRSQETYPASFGREYRNFLDILLRYDHSVAQASNLVELMTPNQRNLFLNFFLVTLVRSLMRHAAYEDPCIDLEFFSSDAALSENEYQRAFERQVDPLYSEAIREALSMWLNRFLVNRSELFNGTELFVFRYYAHMLEKYPELVDEKEKIEAFLVALDEYAALLKRFEPYSNDVIREARRIRESLVPVKEESFLSLGGYAGVRPSGNLDHAESLLPSELAYMEQNARPDLFDVHILENRLLFFTREQNFSLRKKRRFHIIFWEPHKLNYKSRFLPIRWSFVFLALIFEMIRLFRDHFSLKYYPFQFVFSGENHEGEDASKLLEVIAGRDFPDICISSRVCRVSEMPDYFGKEITGSPGDHSCIFFVQEKDLKSAVLPTQFATVHQIKVFFGDGPDFGLRIGIEGGQPLYIHARDADRIDGILNRLRDELTLRVIAGHQFREKFFSAELPGRAYSP